MKQLDVDVSPPANTMTFRQGLTPVKFDPALCDRQTDRPFMSTGGLKKWNLKNGNKPSIFRLAHVMH